MALKVNICKEIALERIGFFNVKYGEFYKLILNERYL